MFLVSNKGVTDAAVNLALEEYCFRTLNPEKEYLLFYVNDPTVIIGSHQNPWVETNHHFLNKHSIAVARRISGGGAVYHDRGNLNFSVITNQRKYTLGRFEALTRPIIDALNRQGIPAILALGNVIEVKGRKISGNAQFANMKRLLSHGTLLFNSNLITMHTALKSALSIVSSQGVRSKKRDVGNLIDFLKAPTTMDQFTQTLIADLSNRNSMIGKIELDGKAWDRIHQLANEKYKAWKWVYGRSPKFVVREKIHLGDRINTVFIHVDHGIIERIKNESNRKVFNFENVSAQLIGRRYHPVHVLQIMKTTSD